MKKFPILALSVVAALLCGAVLFSRLDIWWEVELATEALRQANEVYAREILAEKDSAFWFREDSLTEAEDLLWRLRVSRVTTDRLARQAFVTPNPWEAKALALEAKTRARGARLLAERTREAYQSLNSYRWEARFRYAVANQQSERLRQVTGKNPELSLAQVFLQGAAKLLPPEESRTFSGDPAEALLLVQEAEKHLVAARLAFKEAERVAAEAASAEEVVGAAGQTLADTWAELEVASLRFGFDGALKPAFSLYAQGANELAHAVALATDPRERRDYLVIVASAKRARALAETAREELRAVREAADYAQRWLNLYGSRREAVEGVFPQAARALAFLELYHTKSVWEAATENLEEATALLETARREYSAAQEQYSDQDFARAGAVSYTALAHLGMARDEAAAVSRTRERLEEKRLAWPEAYLAAKAAINEAEDITLIEIATQELTRAEDAAAERDWAEAVSQAESAEVVVYYALKASPAPTGRGHMLILLVAAAFLTGLVIAFARVRPR